MLSKRILFYDMALIMLLSTLLYSQPPDTTWTKTYRNTLQIGTGESIIQNSDSSYYFVGTTSGNLITLMKLNKYGDTLWSKFYDGSYGFSLKRTYDNNLIIPGETSYKGYLLKVDTLGVVKWPRIFQTASTYTRLNNIQCTSDSGFIMSGSTGEVNYLNVYVVKTDSLGDTLWTRTIGGGLNDEGTYVIETTNNEYFVIGCTRSYGSGGSDIYLLKLSNNGDTIFTRTYGGPYNDYAYKIEQISDGFVLVGSTLSPTDDSNIYLIKIDNNADTVWTRTYGTSSFPESGISVEGFSNGDLIVAGGGYINSTKRDDCILLKLNAYGDSLWMCSYGGNDYDQCHGFIETIDGGYLFHGQTNTGAGPWMPYLIKINPDLSGVNGHNAVQTPHLNVIVFPNPFSRKTVILYNLNKASHVTSSIYNIQGQKVNTLVNNQQPPGLKSIYWDGKNANNIYCSSGIYLITLNIDASLSTKKVLLLR